MRTFFLLSTALVVSFSFSGCSSEPVVIEATPEQQQIYAEEYAAEMQAKR
ncbi:hypothetical protein SAMN06265222_101554 [Neorhodopirellula lusitana]|uniref:Secreted protein n=1 Tax=Neorhodopirellula lusitana TaxID=445327 RepID=A0ABY1PQ30_9BACT|nr:hypothetical protein [Neorhodopirellula lusitana]SMP41268.1 hypothetical protein SAMN06265222_101554 [Neorhodopirellula lusitana]